MRDEGKGKRKASKSFARRIIKVWVFGMLVPLLVVEVLILLQFYRINHNDVDEEINNNLNKVSSDMKDLMNSMNSVSWLLEAMVLWVRIFICILMRRIRLKRGIC